LHTAPVEGLAVSPDGRTAASASRDGTLKVWDIASRRQVGETVEAMGGFACVAYAPGGKVLAAGGFAGDLVLVEGRVKRVLQASSASGAAIRAVAFAPDGTSVATGSDDGMVRVWDVASGRVSYALEDHVRAAVRPNFVTGESLPTTLQGLAFAPNGRMLASIRSNGQVTLWDTSSGRIRRQISGGCGALWSVAFSPDGRVLALGGSQGIALLDVEGDRSRRCPSVAGRVTSIRYLPNGTTLTSASSDGIDLWEVSGDPVHLRRLESGGKPVKPLAVSPDGTRIVVGTADGGVLSWNLAE
jgi:WD40 repeat protein